MWGKKGVGVIVRNVLLIIAIIGLVFALYQAMQQISLKSAQQDAELSQIYTQQKQQQEEVRQEALSTTFIDDEYQKDLATIEQYLPGIVCWGDNNTGSLTNTLSYPYVLQTYLNTCICDVYDLRKAFDNWTDYPRVNWKDYKISIPVINMGAGKESSYTVLGRAGAIPFTLGDHLNVPAECEPVPVVLRSSGGNGYNAVTPLTGGDGGVNPVVIDGIEGRLTMDADMYGHTGSTYYYFTRSTPGSAVTIPAGTLIKTAASDLYKDYIHIVFVGVYGDYSGADDLVQQVKTLLARQARNPERFLVLGPFDSFYGSNVYNLDAVDTAMLQAFGNRYISIRNYFCGDGTIGVELDSQDKYFIELNLVPPVFKQGQYSLELNSRAHRMLGRLIYNRMQSLGYFDEINTELNLVESTKEIIQDNAGYFEAIVDNILNVSA